MNLKEAAGLLGWKREQVELAIIEGVETPETKTRVRLAAPRQGSDFDIPEEEIDRLLAVFEAQQPGRHPPVSVRRELLVECGYQCSVCESDAPLRFHHILDWANLKHHDSKHMLAVCGSCHDKIGLGQIDTKAQKILKEDLVGASARLFRLQKESDKLPSQVAGDWSTAAHEALIRNVEFAVVYRPSAFPDRDYVLPVSNGCLVEENRVLTCNEALELAQEVAIRKGGKVIILRGHIWHHFEVEEVDEATGLSLCRITGRQEDQFQELLQLIHDFSVEQGVDVKTVEGAWLYPPLERPVEWTITPRIGQEVGFILASDSQDSLRQAEVSRVEFDTSVVSYFRLPKRRGLKTFVTAVVSGRIRQLGSAVYSRNSALLGIISGIEQFEFDAGRRAVVKTLLGFPRFTQPKLKRD